MAKRKEWVPWYRRPGFKGDVSEEHKRILDAYRVEGKHHAVRIAALPDEVRSVLIALEDEMKEAAETLLGTRALFGLILVVGLAYNYPNTLGFTVAGILFVVGWYFARREWKQLQESTRLSDEETGAPNSIDERLQKAWEIERLVEMRRESRA